MTRQLLKLNPPAGQIEAEAMAAVARKRLAEWGDLYGIGVAMTHPDAGSILMRRFLRYLATQHGVRGEQQVVMYARNGSNDADSVVCEMHAEYTNRHERPTVLIGAYMLDRPHIPRRRGPKGMRHGFQDCIAVFLMSVLLEQFPRLRPNRNPIAARQVSASMIVATVLTEIGRPVTPKRVEEIWRLLGPKLNRAVSMT